MLARDAALARPRRLKGDVGEREGLVYTALEAERLSDPSVGFDRELVELVWDTATALDREDYSLLDLHVRRDLSVDQLTEQYELARDDVAWNLSRLCDWFDSTVRLKLLATRSRRSCAGLAADLSANGSSIELVARRHARECASAGRPGGDSRPQPRSSRALRRCRRRSACGSRPPGCF